MNENEHLKALINNYKEKYYDTTKFMSTNKRRTPLQTQVDKIGLHDCTTKDYIFILHNYSDNTILSELDMRGYADKLCDKYFPNNKEPSDHTYVNVYTKQEMRNKALFIDINIQLLSHNGLDNKDRNIYQTLNHKNKKIDKCVFHIWFLKKKSDKIKDLVNNLIEQSQYESDNVFFYYGGYTEDSKVVSFFEWIEDPSLHVKENKEVINLINERNDEFDKSNEFHRTSLKFLKIEDIKNILIFIDKNNRNQQKMKISVYEYCQKCVISEKEIIIKCVDFDGYKRYLKLTSDLLV